MSEPSRHPGEDRLVDLAAGLLDPEAREALLGHLRGCASCEARLLEIYRGSERLATRAALSMTVSWRTPAVLGAAREGAPAIAVPARIPRRAVWIGAAATAALVAAIAVFPRWLDRHRDDGLDYWMPLESEAVMIRSAEVPVDAAPFRAAVDAYAARDARRVIALLDGREIPRAYEPLNLLLASALVWEGRNPEARALLDRLDILTLPEPARDRSRYLLAVALWREGRTGEAKAIARDLASGAGDLRERAQALLARP